MIEHHVDFSISNMENYVGIVHTTASSVNPEVARRRSPPARCSSAPKAPCGCLRNRLRKSCKEHEPRTSRLQMTTIPGALWCPNAFPTWPPAPVVALQLLPGQPGFRPAWSRPAQYPVSNSSLLDFHLHLLSRCQIAVPRRCHASLPVRKSPIMTYVFSA